MMKTVTREEHVARFHSIVGQPNNVPMDLDTMKLRRKLILEEATELLESIDLVIHHKLGPIVSPSEDQLEAVENMIKEMADLQYVLSGMAATFGINLDVAFNRVQASNLSKLDDNGKPIFREDGKVLKGPNYKPPVLTDMARELM
jgi:predicted HAD superfamily Cof-like phosphohydrolase